MSRRYFPRLVLVSAFVIGGGLVAPAVSAHSVSNLSPSQALNLESESATFQMNSQVNHKMCPFSSYPQRAFDPTLVTGAEKQIAQEDELGKPGVAASISHRYARTVAWCYEHQATGLGGNLPKAAKLTGHFLFLYVQYENEAYKSEAGQDKSALVQAKIGRDLIRSEPVSPARNTTLAKLGKIIKSWEYGSHASERAQKTINNTLIQDCVNEANLGIADHTCDKYPAYRKAQKTAAAKLKQQQAQQKSQYQSSVKRACMDSFAAYGATPPPQYHCSQFKGFTKKWKASRKRTCARMKAMKAPFMPPYCNKGSGS